MTVARRTARKIGCEAGKDAMVEGVYVILLANGQLYIGQSILIGRRFEEHLRSLEKQGARLVGMLRVTTGIDNGRAAKYFREILEGAMIRMLRPGANVIQNPASNPNRLTRYTDPVRVGVEKVFEVIPFCKEKKF